MPDYLLDTHACVFALSAPEKLGRGALRALRTVERGAAKAWIPAAVVAELVILHELGRIGISLPQLETAMEQAPGLCFLPLDLDQLREFSAHAAIRDPFDRLIVSAARSKAAKLLTRDQRITEYGLVQTVWD